MPVTELPPADDAANAAFNSLTSGVDFDVPIANMGGAVYQLPAATGPLYAVVTKLENADLTTGAVGGTGTFDALMQGFAAHLRTEYEKNRITGAEYTKAFIALTEGAMSNSVQFLLAKETSYWQALSAQVQAQVAQVQLVTSRVALETAKAQLQQVQLEGQAAKANYALTKMKLATEAVAYDGAAFTLSYLLPQQLILLTEQTEVQRAQTLDTRTDGAEVLGSVGKQKALYTQQITSYKRDAEVKAAKIFSDAWITQKTIDEGLTAPTGFTNASLDTILSALKINNDLN